MSLVSNFNPEDSVPTRADILDMLKNINKNVKPKKDTRANAKARNQQRKDALIPGLKGRGLSDKQVAAILSDLPSYLSEWEDDGVPHAMREM